MANSLGLTNPLRYRGYVYDDETGLYYLQSRYYNPTIGRFLNADAYISTGQGCLGNNMFAYCGNNPVMHSDPSGCNYDVADRKSQEKYCVYICLMGGGGSALIFVAPKIVDGLSMLLREFEDQLEIIRAMLLLSLAKAKQLKYRSTHEWHHIAAKRSKNALRAAGILNMVLADGVEDDQKKIRLKTAVHRRIHTKVYYSLVNDAVSKAYDLAWNDKQQQQKMLLLC